AIVVEKRLEQFVKGTIQISLSVTSNGLAFDSDSRSHAPRGNALRDALRHKICVAPLAQAREVVAPQH
ncbi:hypothetical protein, partial [Pseudomonas amygdali]|uniref:hypothetical protein n=1 Tax=Pseudomonas amygdali TaxID=47877 RepID=UPI001C7EBD80